MRDHKLEFIQKADDGVVPKLKIVIAAHTPIGAPFVVGSHHIAREIALLGHDVRHVPFPFTAIDLFRDENQVFGRLRARSLLRPRHLLTGNWALEKLQQISPFSLLPWRISGRHMTEAYLATNARLTWFGKGREAADLLFIDHPRQAWVTFAIPAKKIIYRPTDIYSFPGNRDDEVILALERFLIRRADMIITTSEAVAERMGEFMRDMELTRPLEVVLNGVDLDVFATSSASTSTNRLRKTAVYVGAVDERFDAGMLGYFAHHRPDVDFVIAGPLQKREPLPSLPENVRILGAVPYEKVPQLLQGADVALLPLNDHPFNASRSPMKLYEYAASGLPVVCRFTPELAKRNESFMHFYRNGEEALVALQRALNVDAEARQRAREAAASQSWRAKVKHLLDLVIANG